RPSRRRRAAERGPGSRRAGGPGGGDGQPRGRADPLRGDRPAPPEGLRADPPQHSRTLMINGTPDAMFRSLRIAASGLSAQRARLETTATNIANAETTRGPDGQPYRRRVVELQPRAFAPDMPPAPTVETLFAMATPEGAARIGAAHG